MDQISDDRSDVIGHGLLLKRALLKASLEYLKDKKHSNDRSNDQTIVDTNIDPDMSDQ